jgi:hypothetical protein
LGATNAPLISHPAWHAAVWQISPVLQAAPSGSGVHADVVAETTHAWQAFSGFGVPSGYCTLSIVHGTVQMPLLQNIPDPQGLPEFCQ